MQSSQTCALDVLRHANVLQNSSHDAEVSAAPERAVRSAGSLCDLTDVAQDPPRPCFARQYPVRTDIKEHAKFAMRAPDGTQYAITKLHAFAIWSGHPRCSKDRSLRVQTMARHVPVLLSDHARVCADAETHLPD